MTDDVIGSLAAEFLAGDVGSLRPLIDRLYETRDPRWRKVARALAEAASRCRAAPGRAADDEGEGMTSQTRAHLALRRRKRAWEDLRSCVRRHLALELAGGVPSLDETRALAAWLDVPSLTLAWTHEDGMEALAEAVATLPAADAGIVTGWPTPAHLDAGGPDPFAYLGGVVTGSPSADQQALAAAEAEVNSLRQELEELRLAWGRREEEQQQGGGE